MTKTPPTHAAALPNLKGKSVVSPTSSSSTTSIISSSTLPNILSTSVSMALHISLSPAPVRPSPPFPCTGKQPVALLLDSKTGFSSKSLSVITSSRTSIGVGSLKVNSSLETTGATVGQVTEVNSDTFWPIVNAAGDKTVVLDMYTQWCGPCKVLAPKFQQLSEKYLDVIFLKLDCNHDNRPLSKELGIKVVPTFKILKDKKVVKEVTGAKYDDLVHAIDAVRSS